MQASEIMTTDPRCCSAGDSLQGVANAMAKEAVRRIPITDKEGRLCGILAQADLEHSGARSQKEKVSQRVSTPQ